MPAPKDSGKAPTTTSCNTFCLGLQGVIVPGVASGERGNWGWELRQLANRGLALRRQPNSQNAVFFFFFNESFGWNQALYTLLIYKDVERFRNGSVHEFYSLISSVISKVHASYHVITNEAYMSSKYENTNKAIATDFSYRQTMMLRQTPHVLKNSRIFLNRTLKVRQTAEWAIGLRGHTTTQL